MATVKKNKKKVIIPICIVLVIAIIAGVIFGVSASKSGEEVSLYTIGNDDIIETVSLTGDVSAGTVKEYKVGTVATVKEVFVKVGDEVKQNDLLATFDITELDAQIQSLQASYDASLASYNSAVATQKAAKSKIVVLEKEISETERLVAELQDRVDNPTTTVKETAKTTAKTTTKPTTKATTTIPTTTTTTTTVRNESTTAPSIGALTDAIQDLNNALIEITKDIETLTQTTQIIASTIVELQGSLDNEAIADRIVQNLVDSGIAESMAQQIVASIDVEAIASAIANTDNSQLTAAQVQLVALQGQYAIFKAQADGSVVNAQKTAVNATKEALDTLKKQKQEMSEGWKAAFDGTITAVDITPGMQTTLLSSGITLENLNSMAVKLSLSEYDLHKVRVGMPATVTTAYGTYNAEVTSIAPTATGGSSGGILDSVGSMAGISGLSSLTATGAGVECIVSIPKTDENITAGFNADVEIKTGEYLGVTVVPIESIKLEKTGSYVYLYNAEEGTVTKTKIETGAVSDTAYEIKSGLNAGDQIVAAPAADYEEDTFKVKVVTK